MEFQTKVTYKALNKYLICTVCKGYYRFAHTITDCGHTFCKVCILNQQKVPQTRGLCPFCGNKMSTDWKKSVKKDTFKQSLVDTVYPEYSMREQAVVKRIQQLYPKVDLDELLEEFNYEQVNMVATQVTKKKKLKKDEEDDTQSSNMLKQLVQQSLSLDMEEFQRIVYDGDADRLQECQQKISTYYEKIEEEERIRQKQLEEEAQRKKQQEDSLRQQLQPKDNRMLKDSKYSTPKPAREQLGSSDPLDNGQASTSQRAEDQKEGEAASFNLYPKAPEMFELFKFKQILKIKNTVKGKAKVRNVKIFLKKQIQKNFESNPDAIVLDSLMVSKITIDDIYIYFKGIIQDDEQEIDSLSQQNSQIIGNQVEEGSKQFRLEYELRVPGVPK